MSQVIADYLTDKTGIKWTLEHYEAVFGEDACDTDPKVYELLENSMRFSLPPGLFDEVEGVARVYAAVAYAANNGNVGKLFGFDPLCEECGRLFLKYWGAPGEPGAMSKLNFTQHDLGIDIGQAEEAGFIPIGKQPDRDSALVEAITEFGGYKPEGVMAVRFGGKFWISDGVNPNTGENYTEAERELIRSACDELLIAA